VANYGIHQTPAGLEIAFSSSGRHEVELATVNGRTVVIGRVVGVKAFLDTRSLAPGVYALKVLGASGARTARILVR
jgi:hypothetical protein